MSGTRRSLARPARRWAGALVPAGLIAASLVAASPAHAAVTVPISPPRGIAAAAGELVNATTGRQLWGRQTYLSRPVASLAKVMTALVVLEAGHIGRYITITRAEVNYVVEHGASSAGLHAGDVLTARQLLYAMLLPSGADAAMALAISYGPGLAAFVRKMNAMARALHLAGTHFTNFDGLPSSNVSTPRNLLALGKAAMGMSFFREVVGSKSHRLPVGRLHHSYLWQNTNLLLGRYRGSIGIKTGWTPAAGECLLFEAVRRTRTLIGVVLDSAPTKNGQTFIDAAKLLNWGFEPHT